MTMKTIDDVVDSLASPLSDYRLHKKGLTQLYTIGKEFAVYAWDTYHLLFRYNKDNTLKYDSHYNVRK